jgi:hypothetical protein
MQGGWKARRFSIPVALELLLRHVVLNANRFLRLAFADDQSLG